MFGRDVPAVAGLNPAHAEWNRLHRTPPSFPQPPSWLKAEAEREREVERKKEETPRAPRESPRAADKEREQERYQLS